MSPTYKLVIDLLAATGVGTLVALWLAHDDIGARLIGNRKCCEWVEYLLSCPVCLSVWLVTIASIVIHTTAEEANLSVNYTTMVIKNTLVALLISRVAIELILKDG